MHSPRSLSQRRAQRRRAGPLVVGLLLLAAVGFASPGFALDLPAHFANATYVGDETCVTCHSDLGDSLAVGVHGMMRGFQAPDGQTGCESCHGPGSLHTESNDPADIINPGKADATLTDRMCLQCHRNDNLDGFEMSIHAQSNVSCTSCHGIHGVQRQRLLKKQEPELCYGCHTDVQNQIHLPSHHPIAEGKMVCTDCHDPHREAIKTELAGGTKNELCLGCHADKQGPFIFEHAPVVEDCMICHEPHGAVANNMLTQNEPFLCLQCHQAHFHATLQGVDGDFETIDGYTGVSHPDGAKRGMLTKCTQCHSEIHGSDLPSESISGQGRALTR